jgi:hypothetical protein
MCCSIESFIVFASVFQHWHNRTRGTSVAVCRIMFDEEGEKILHSTDLHERLEAALDGPDAWMRWDLARSMARNIKFKLEEPPQRAIATRFWDRVQYEFNSFVQHFPKVPPEWLEGDRIDDPTVTLPARPTRYVICDAHEQPIACLPYHMHDIAPVHGREPRTRVVFACSWGGAGRRSCRDPGARRLKLLAQEGVCIGGAAGGTRVSCTRLLWTAGSR